MMDEWAIRAIIKDRDDWKARCLRAEELLASCRESSAQRAKELMELKGGKDGLEPRRL